MARPSTNPLVRWWWYVETGDDVRDCWEWTGTLKSGYGGFRPEGRRNSVGAHRWIYEFLHGNQGPLQIDHLCRNHSCVNPLHLEAVTCRENLLRSPISIAGMNKRKTHCKRGHEFNETNTYSLKLPNGGEQRNCRICAWMRKNGKS